MISVSQLCQALPTVLTTVADQAARATRFVQRASKLTGANFLFPRRSPCRCTRLRPTNTRHRSH